jgi:hypothetical protein
MTIRELRLAWQAALHQAALECCTVGEVDDRDLARAAGLVLRSGLKAGVAGLRASTVKCPQT